MKKSEQQKTVAFESIILGTRMRKKYDGIAALASSIKEHGLIQPIVLAATGSVGVQPNELIAGGRRYHAFLELRKTPEGREAYAEVPVAYRLIEQPSDLRLLELEENIRRDNMKWQEICLGIAEFHEAARAEKRTTRWTQSATGHLLGKTQGQVAVALQMAAYLRKNDEGVWGASSLAEAAQVLAAREAAAIAAEGAKRMAARHAEELERAKKAGAVEADNDAEENAAETPVDAASKTPVEREQMPVQTPATKKTGSPTGAGSGGGKRPLAWTAERASAFYRRGDAIAWMKELKKTKVPVAHIITDPPYILDLDNFGDKDDTRNEGGLDELRETHSVDNVRKLMEKFFPLAFDLLPETGFLCTWTSVDGYYEQVELAEDAGFTVQKWPVVWVKNVAQNRQAQYNFTKTVEFCMIARKGPRAVLAKQQPDCVINCPSMRELTRQHRFAKPFQVWKRLIEAVSVQGETILDPFAGMGTSLAAMLRLSRIPVGIECEDIHIMSGTSFIAEQMNTSLL